MTIKFSENIRKPINYTFLNESDIFLTIRGLPFSTIKKWEVKKVEEDKLEIKVEFDNPLEISKSAVILRIINFLGLGCV